ncbi:MAG: hypothetical protein K0R57_2192 [Paenibacillaceae bacterium]|jgi:hypothetical protein|nr:hypothetical protein [Paenibacillaceae bacterium]
MIMPVESCAKPALQAPILITQGDDYIRQLPGNATLKALTLQRLSILIFNTSRRRTWIECYEKS